jgi:hypothetical protein
MEISGAGHSGKKMKRCKSFTKILVKRISMSGFISLVSFKEVTCCRETYTIQNWTIFTPMMSKIALLSFLKADTR